MKNFLITSAAFLALTACVSSDDYDTPGINPLKCPEIDLATGTAPYVQSFTGQATGAISDTFDWKTVTEDGSRAFDIQDFSKANPYLQMSSFGSGSTNKTWIISPTFDFSTVTDKFISFTLADAYQNGNPVKLKYSTDYTGATCPSKATWTEIGATEIAALINNTAKYDNKFESTGDIAVPATGKVVFAIVYEGSSTGITTTVQIDDIKIGQKSVVTPPVLTLKTLSEVRTLGVNAVMPANTKISGTVISDYSNNSISNLNIILQDGSNAGLVVRFKNAATFAKGDNVEVNISGLTLTADSEGILQFNNVDNTLATKVGTGTIAPQVITLSELMTNGVNYESELISLANVKYTQANLANTFLSNSGNATIGDTGTVTTSLYTRTAFTTLGATVLPSGTGTITAIVSKYGGLYQLVPRDVAEVVFTSTPPVVTTNLVKNPSFESGLTDWTKGPTTSYIDPTVVTTPVQDGTKALQYAAPTATTGFYQNIAVEAGATYKLSFYYNVSTIGTANQNARVYCNWQDAASANVTDAATDALLRGGNKTSTSGYLPDGTVGTYQLYEVTIKVPATGVTQLQFAVRSYKNATVTFDNFSLVKQ